jgi:hypothetical protein
MKRIMTIVMLICILSGCMLMGVSEPTPITTIGEIGFPNGKLELTVVRGNDSLAAAELYAVDGSGGARVHLQPEDINKLRDMLDKALSFPPSADTWDTPIAIGIIESYERTGLGLSVIQHNGERAFRMLAVGIYGKPRLHFDLSRDELKTFGRLVSKAITELDKESPVIAPQEQSK